MHPTLKKAFDSFQSKFQFQDLEIALSYMYAKYASMHCAIVH